MRSDNEAERDRDSAADDWLGGNLAMGSTTMDGGTYSVCGLSRAHESQDADGDHHVRLVQAIQTELIPRLLNNRRANATRAEMASHARSAARCTAAVQELCRVILHEDDQVAQAVVEELLDSGIALEQIYLDVLSPTAQRLGAMWEADTCNFADVTLGLWRVQRILYDLSIQFRSEPQVHLDPSIEGKRILLAAAPDCQHNFGVSMLGEFFSRAGWLADVAQTPSLEYLQNAVRTQWFDVVGVSVGSEHDLAGLSSVIVALRRASRNPRLIVMVGGAAFAHHPEYVARVGADCTGADAKSALAAAADRVLALEHRC